MEGRHIVALDFPVAAPTHSDPHVGKRGAGYVLAAVHRAGRVSAAAGGQVCEARAAAPGAVCRVAPRRRGLDPAAARAHARFAA